jgi:hypothetical protein
MYSALIAILVFFQSDAPFKPKESFEIKFDLSFKLRDNDSKTIHLDETRADYDKRNNSTPLPYLVLHVKILDAQQEVKLKVIKDNKSTILSKKIEPGMVFKLDLGFTDDIKDGISGYKHVIQFYSPKKEIVSRIVIEFDKEGNYFVNGEKRGRV